MFFVFSRKKICSYFLAMGMVAILLSVSNFQKDEETVQTSSNVQNKNIINSINYIENEKNIVN